MTLFGLDKQGVFMLSGHCDSAYRDFTYNINKYNITHNGLHL
jgi:hypothetical protein